MDVVLERKEVSDLASSIMDGRYNEQKFRLEASSLGTVVYILEGDKPARLHMSTLESAMFTTQARVWHVVPRRRHVPTPVEAIA
jgi:crossover junction endonuclease MUS81